MTKISIIIPVYNIDKYLSRCIESCIKQSLKDIEIICINDGSTDTSQSIIDHYILNDSRLKKLSIEYITPNVPLVSLTNVPDISLLNVPLFTGCN